MGLARTRPRPRSTARSGAGPPSGGGSAAAIRRATAAGATRASRASGSSRAGSFVLRTVGSPLTFDTRTSREVVTFRFAFIDRSPARVPGNLVGGEHGSLATDPLGRPVGPEDHAAQARSHSAAHVLLHGDLQERLPPGGRGAGRVG